MEGTLKKQKRKEKNILRTFQAKNGVEQSKEQTEIGSETQEAVILFLTQKRMTKVSQDLDVFLTGGLSSLRAPGEKEGLVATKYEPGPVAPSPLLLQSGWAFIL